MSSETHRSASTGGKNQASLSHRLARSAEKHGYTGRFGVLSYAIRSVRNHILNLIALHLPPIGIVSALHRARGVKIGANVFIGEEVFIDTLYPEMIQIEDGAFLAARCIVLAHMRDLTKYRKGMWVGDCPHVVKPVKIGEGANVGMGTVILPGVTIGKGAIIGAGAVVSQDIPDYTVAAGVPAKVIKEIPEPEQARQEFRTK